MKSKTIAVLGAAAAIVVAGAGVTVVQVTAADQARNCGAAAVALYRSENEVVTQTQNALEGDYEDGGLDQAKNYIDDAQDAGCNALNEKW